MVGFCTPYRKKATAPGAKSCPFRKDTCSLAWSQFLLRNSAYTSNKFASAAPNTRFLLPSLKRGPILDCILAAARILAPRFHSHSPSLFFFNTSSRFRIIIPRERQVCRLPLLLAVPPRPQILIWTAHCSRSLLHWLRALVSFASGSGTCELLRAGGLSIGISRASSSGSQLARKLTRHPLLAVQ